MRRLYLIMLGIVILEAGCIERPLCDQYKACAAHYATVVKLPPSSMTFVGDDVCESHPHENDRCENACEGARTALIDALEALDEDLGPCAVTGGAP